MRSCSAVRAGFQEEGVSDESAGLPLKKALRTYGDPQLLATYEKARAALKRIPPHPTWLNSSRREREEWRDQYKAAQPASRNAVDSAWAKLVADFMERLRSGELTATGIKVPVHDESQPIVITRYLWFDLVPDFTRSSAKGRGSEFVGVRVRRASLDPDSTAQRVIDGPSFVGRPSLMRAVEQEMRGRAERGELCAKLAEECRVLAAWVREAFPNHQTPGAKAIENGLRSVYWQLKPRGTP